MTDPAHVTDGQHTVSSDPLRGGERYVFRLEEDGKGHMEHLPRRPVEDSWPRLSVSPQALRQVRTFTHGMGRNQGARPPYSWVASILLEHACRLPDADAIVRQGIYALMVGPLEDEAPATDQAAAELEEKSGDRSTVTKDE